MQLAQINIGRIKGPIDGPVMAEFANNLDRINALAESSDGFIWRLKDDTNNATSIRVYEDEFMLMNMSVWQDIDSLFDYVYQTAHVEFLKRRKEWFFLPEEMHMALWYIEDGEYPGPLEGKARLEHLRQHGETPYAFSFKKRFSIEDFLEYQYK